MTRNMYLFPREPLEAHLRARGAVSVPECARMVGMSERAWQRWKTDGLPGNKHDPVAVSLGVEPEEIWDEALIEGYWEMVRRNNTTDRSKRPHKRSGK